MSTRDEIDRQRAQRYAWRIPSSDGPALADLASSLDSQADEEETESGPDAASVDTEFADEAADWRPAAMASATQLAPRVHQTWRLLEGQPQAQVVTKLLRAALHPE